MDYDIVQLIDIPAAVRADRRVQIGLEFRQAHRCPPQRQRNHRPTGRPQLPSELTNIAFADTALPSRPDHPRDLHMQAISTYSQHCLDMQVTVFR
ncbi:hypothetical protein [Streptomyces deccanensis]|uniref:hypothetical protein n=1 Tax=Streptomyces deccanensis TaxID=424188 RepID=UPI001EFB0CBA|nr:hypothetical protein [Streptomyces deccanensis]ULR51042.1 hypothetical protein L3078_18010 [Streptomyces deccanensis]